MRASRIGRYRLAGSACRWASRVDSFELGLGFLNIRWKGNERGKKEEGRRGEERVCKISVVLKVHVLRV